MENQGESVAEPWAEPFFGFVDGDAFALGVVFDLIFLKFADHEVVRLGVREVEAADGGARMHGAGLGEFDSDFFLRIEEFKKGRFFGVVRLGWVAWSRPDALVFFVDEFGLGELAGALDAP